MIGMRLRFVAAGLLVVAVIAGAFAVMQIESVRDGVLVLAGGLALAAVAGALAVTTERRRRALREVDRYFTLASEMVTVAGFDGYWTRVNPAVEAVLGYSEREALERPVIELVHPDDRERSEQETRRVVEGATAHGVELRILCKDGSYKWIEWNATPIPGERMMYGVGRDVTERRRSEREQTALQRISTLVAQEVPQTDVFAALVEEIAALLGTREVRMLRFEGDTSAVVVGSSGRRDAFPLGSHQQLEGDSVASRVRRMGQPVRIDDDSAPVGPLAETARSLGVRAVVGVPVCVDELLWGAVIAGSTDEPLPPDTEARLLHFMELTATAISNTEARDARAVLAEEQAALRRVATLVAYESSPVATFSAVTEEAARVLACDAVGLLRFEPDETATLVAQSDTPWDPPPLGTRFTLDGENLMVQVFRTGLAARADDWTGSSGSVAAMATVLGVRSAVASPVVVEGRLWGTIIAASSQSEPLPTEMEARIGQFTELVATAIANAESREALARLAAEQAALRRVATHVARGIGPEEVFRAVAAEVGTLFGADVAAIVRFEDDGTVTVLGDVGGPHQSGKRVSLDEGYVVHRVRETSRSARFDTDDPSAADMPSLVQALGIRSSVASPIVVEGKLWGAITAASVEGPLPLSAERRLTEFTELVATAVANTQSREHVAALADEQAALRRVATLVAASAAPSDVFAAVTEEIALVLGAEVTLLCRADPDGAAVVVGTWGDNAPEPGTRIRQGGTNLTTIVLETGHSARIESYDEATGDASEVARSHGLRSAVGVPILVEAGRWGLVIAGTTGDEPLPPDAEERLAGFTELVATAIANAESQYALERAAAEQATLRRIATLVARGVEPAQVFAAVAKETAATFHAITRVLRFEHDPPGVVIVGASQETGAPVGTRWAFEEGMASAEVFRTGRSARVGVVNWSPDAGPVAEAALRLGVSSQVSCPIIVEGSLWGVIAVNAQEELPPDTEERLEGFTELVTTAIANTESRSELAASRRRIVAASDETRRQIERDLHDGTQQRLVSLGLALRAAEANLPAERDDLRAQLSGVATGLVAAVEDLQEISRGIHPAILSKGGLGPALQALAHRSAIPVDLDIRLDVRLEEPIEVAAYFVASEALANAAKHSQASRVDVSLEQRDGRLLLAVRDDGVGGADAARGSGLVGLTDRVEALGGWIRVSSQPGKGTQLAVDLPVELKLAPAAG
jgi:PAS domain S-box-containing protein